MVFEQMDKDGSPRYLRRQGENVILTREKRGNLLDEVPAGWRVKRLPNGKLKLVRN